jgi:hypothetical protein
VQIFVEKYKYMILNIVLFYEFWPCARGAQGQYKDRKVHRTNVFGWAMAYF